MSYGCFGMSAVVYERSECLAVFYTYHAMVFSFFYMALTKNAVPLLPVAVLVVHRLWDVSFENVVFANLVVCCVMTYHMKKWLIP